MWDVCVCVWGGMFPSSTGRWEGGAQEKGAIHASTHNGACIPCLIATCTFLPQRQVVAPQTDPTRHTPAGTHDASARMVCVDG